MQKRMKVILVDDERIARLALRTLLEEEPSAEIIGEAASGEEALPLIEQLRPDVLFLDVQMPGISGLDLVAQIPFPLPTVFVSTSEAFALRAFEVNALDYLQKPVQPARLKETLRRVASRLYESAATVESFSLNNSDLAFLPLESGQIFVRADTLVWIESHGNYSRVFTSDQRRFTVRRSLNAWETMLDPACFYRISRTAIIRFGAIQRLEPKEEGGVEVHLSGSDQSFPVSRRHVAELKRMLAERA
jgi:two-component system LytT family response regulator